MRREEKLLFNEELVVELVLAQRRKLPRLGGKKLYRILKAELTKMGVKIGRDKFFEILSHNNLLVARKRNYARTTNSMHRFRVYKNLIIGRKTDRAWEIIVSDITYLRLSTGFCYLSLITDVGTRKIVGYDLSDNLGIEGSLRALKMAMKEVRDPVKLTHHSDRGIQYCSAAYTGILKDRGIAISMSEQGNPYENAVAERINGILKQEFLLDATFKSIGTAKQAVDEAIRSYNTLRPHMSIGYQTPEERYQNDCEKVKNSKQSFPHRKFSIGAVNL